MGHLLEYSGIVTKTRAMALIGNTKKAVEVKMKEN